MLIYTKKDYGPEASAVDEADSLRDDTKDDPASKQSIGLRLMSSLLQGGKAGVELGLGIIPGVLIICTLVMMLTNGPAAGSVYTGAAYEGIGLLPKLAGKIQFLLQPLFGFSSAACTSVPVTALGSAGASLGIVKSLIETGEANANDVAVFTAMCMCWSGYLSTHVSMMDVLKARRFVGKSILFHTLGGLLAGFVAHMLFLLLG